MQKLTLFTVVCSNGTQGQFINIKDMTDFINTEYGVVANRFIRDMGLLIADTHTSFVNGVAQSIRNTKPTITHVDEVTLEIHTGTYDDDGELSYSKTQSYEPSYIDVRWNTDYNSVLFNAKITKSEITVNNSELSEHLGLFQQRYDGTFGVPYNYSHPSAD